MEVMRDESFGPIIGIQRVADDDEAVDLMNDTEYGLTAGVYSATRRGPARILGQLDAGSAYWNCCDRVSPRLPWSGRGHSGIGSTLSTLGHPRLRPTEGVAPAEELSRLTLDGRRGSGGGAAVRDDEHRREPHRARRDHRVEHAERGERDGGDVVGEGPEQVALDRRERAARQTRWRRPAARRSPETIVRSLASMATSVPVPMAMPRSACASAGASLTPSPTIATALALGLQALDLGDLVGGQHLGARPSSMPTSSATAAAVRLLSPVSRTTSSPSSCSAATAARLDGLTCRRRRGRPCAVALATVAAHPASTAVRPAASAAAAVCSTSAGTSSNSERPPDEHGDAVDVAATPPARQVLEVVDRRRAAPARARDRLRDRVLRPALDRAGAAQQRRAVDAVRRDTRRPAPCGLR